MQTALSKILILVSESISYDDNHYTMISFTSNTWQVVLGYMRPVVSNYMQL